jgi:DnaJ family protein A protein 2
MIKDKEYYDILDINVNATDKEIKDAYKKKALTLHPDKGGNEDDFKKLNEAYNILLDNDKRYIYDMYGKEGVNNNINQNVVNINDILNQFNFMSGIGFMNNIFNNNIKKVPIPTEHIRYVTLEEICLKKKIKIKYTRTRECKCVNNNVNTCNMCNGLGIQITKIEMSYNFFNEIRTKCNKCNGIGKIYNGCKTCKNGIIEESKIFEIDLNTNMEDGHKILYKNEGNQEIGTNIGDFIIYIKYKKHNIYDVDNFNLILNLTITLKEALTGYQTEIIHPSHEIIKINTDGYIITTNDIIELYEKGINKNSNLILKFNIKYPDILTKEKIEILKNIL